MSSSAVKSEKEEEDEEEEDEEEDDEEEEDDDDPSGMFAPLSNRELLDKVRGLVEDSGRQVELLKKIQPDADAFLRQASRLMGRFPIHATAGEQSPQLPAAEEDDETRQQLPLPPPPVLTQPDRVQLVLTGRLLHSYLERARIRFPDGAGAPVDESSDEMSDSDKDLLNRVRGLVQEAVRRTREERGRRPRANNRGDDDHDHDQGDSLEGAARTIERMAGTKRKLFEEERRHANILGEHAQIRMDLLQLLSLRGGTYYSSVDQVWKPRPGSYADPDLFHALRRPQAPTFVSRSIAPAVAAPAAAAAASSCIGAADAKKTFAVCGEDVYAKTLSYAANPDYEAATPMEWNAPPTATGDDKEESHPPPLHGSGNDDDDDKEKEDEASVVWMSSEASSSHPTYRSDVKHDIWTASVVGKSFFTDDIVGLIPKCPDKAALYLDVAACALGRRDEGGDAVSFEVLQKSIFGSRRKKQETAESAGQSGVTDTGVGEDGSVDDDDDVDDWVAGTGLKKIVPNKIRIGGGLVYFDRRPCVLIVPVMDLDEMKAWCGGPYKAIVLPGKWTDMDPLDAIVQALRMDQVAEIASPAQVEQARVLLERVVLGLAHSLHYRLPIYASKLTTAQKDMLHRRLEGFRTIPGAPESVYVPETVQPNQSVLVPPPPTALSPSATAGSDAALSSSAVDASDSNVARGTAIPSSASTVSSVLEEPAQSTTSRAAQSSLSASRIPAKALSPSSNNACCASSAPSEETKPASAASKPLRVRLVEFQGANSNHVANDGATPGHPAPDPFLLAVRAAVTWSWRNHQKVLESGEPEPPIHPLEELAMEQYLELRDQAMRTHARDDVAAGLGQPNGYQGGDDVDRDDIDHRVEDPHVADLYDSVP